MRHSKWRHGGVYQRIFGIFFYRPFVLGRRAHLSHQLCKVRRYPSRLNIHQRCGVEFLFEVSFHQVLTYIINCSDFMHYYIEDMIKVLQNPPQLGRTDWKLVFILCMEISAKDLLDPVLNGYFIYKYPIGAKQNQRNAK